MLIYFNFHKIVKPKRILECRKLCSSIEKLFHLAVEFPSFPDIWRQLQGGNLVFSTSVCPRIPFGLCLPLIMVTYVRDSSHLADWLSLFRCVECFTCRLYGPLRSQVLVYDWTGVCFSMLVLGMWAYILLPRMRL